ncbi:MAG TPA: NifU family protein [Bacteroidia bacterium]|nr:NifU family protein [Bacteroidia bacterium]
MGIITDPDMLNKIEEALAQLRPFLNADGGDMELVEVTENYVLKVKLTGACSSCSMSAMTLKNGVEEAVKKAVPQIISVEAVDF